MTDLPSALPETQSELSAVYRLYSALCAPAFHPDHGLGGSLLYTGDLTPEASRLVRAANIAGAAFPLPQGPLEVVTAFELALAAALDPAAGPAHRWLHLSPRYLPRNLRRFRSIPLGPEALSALRQKLAAFGAVQL